MLAFDNIVDLFGKIRSDFILETFIFRMYFTQKKSPVKRLF